jgi:hypothetical protein
MHPGIRLTGVDVCQKRTILAVYLASSRGSNLTRWAKRQRATVHLAKDAEPDDLSCGSSRGRACRPRTLMNPLETYPLLHVARRTVQTLSRTELRAPP